MRYDVFISCKSEDYELGKIVLNFLLEKGVVVFMADEKLRELGISDYGRAIDDALDNSNHLILVTSSVNNVMPEFSPYVYYEWHTFSEEKKSGRKNGNIMTVVTEMKIVQRLPIALRNNQAFSLDNFGEILSYVIERYDDKIEVLSRLGLTLDKSCDDPEKSYEWDYFAEAIIQKKIIPIIGGDLFKIRDKTLNQFILDELIKKYEVDGSKVNSFSDLAFCMGVEKSYIQQDLYYYWEENGDNLSEIVDTGVIKEILSLPYFPFVVTTNVDPVVEIIMRKIHGDNLRIMVYDKDMSHNNHIDIYDKLLSPTLLYMYGKMNSGFNKYVVNSEDLRIFVKSWLSENDYKKQLHIIEVLQSHYLLFLGYDYKGCVDEFLWQDLKLSDNVHIRDWYKEPFFYEFIQNVELGLKLCPDIIINEINKSIEKTLKEKE